jgi:hypothetical protein
MPAEVGVAIKAVPPGEVASAVRPQAVLARSPPVLRRPRATSVRPLIAAVVVLVAKRKSAVVKTKTAAKKVVAGLPAMTLMDGRRASSLHG